MIRYSHEVQPVQADSKGHSQVSQVSEPLKYRELRTEDLSFGRTECHELQHPALSSDTSKLKKSVHAVPTDRLRTSSRIGPHISHMRTPCWSWTAATDQRGRPRIWAHGGNRLAARI